MDHLSAQLMQFLAPFLPYLLKGVKLAGQTVLLVSGSVIVTVYRNKINTIYLVITHIFCVPTFRQRSSLTTAYFLEKKTGSNQQNA